MVSTILGVKIGALVGLFVFSVLGYFAPLYLKRFKSSQLFFAYANCLSAGFFLSAGLLGLLPECSKLWNESDNHIHYPIPYLCCMGGFFIMFTVEKVVSSQAAAVDATLDFQVEDPHHHHGDATSGDVPRVKIEISNSYGEASPQVCRTVQQLIRSKPVQSHLDILNCKEEGHHDDCHQEFEYVLDASEPLIPNERHDDREELIYCEKHQDSPLATSPHSSMDSEHSHTSHHSHHHHIVIGDGRGKLIVPYILALMLSLHTFVLGFTIGISNGMSQLIQAIVVVGGHKLLESFALGTSMVKGGVPLKTMLWLSPIYCVVGPLGGTLGVVLSANLSHSRSKIAISIGQSIAAGTFLYAAQEILNDEFLEPKHLGWKLILFFAGAAAMAVFVIWS